MIIGGDSLLVRRQTNSGDTDQGGVDSVLVITLCVVLIGGYFIALFLILLTLIYCFVRFNCECTESKCKCNPKCTRRPRVRFPKNVEDNVSVCCGKGCKIFCPCCSNFDEFDSGELGFWIEIVLLGILCFPFALCFVVLWALACNN